MGASDDRMGLAENFQRRAKKKSLKRVLGALEYIPFLGESICGAELESQVRLLADSIKSDVGLRWMSPDSPARYQEVMFGKPARTGYFTFTVPISYRGTDHTLAFRRVYENWKKLEIMADGQSLAKIKTGFLAEADWHVAQAVNNGFLCAYADRFLDAPESQGMIDMMLRLLSEEPISGNFLGEESVSVLKLYANVPGDGVYRFSAPQIIAVNRSKLESGNVLEVALKGDIYALPGESFGLFGYHERDYEVTEGGAGLGTWVKETSRNGEKLMAWNDGIDTKLVQDYVPEIAHVAIHAAARYPDERAASLANQSLEFGLKAMDLHGISSFCVETSTVDNLVGTKIIFTPDPKTYRGAFLGEQAANKALYSSITTADTVVRLSAKMPGSRL